MAVEDHPLYPRWIKALERVIEAKERQDRYEQGTADWTAAKSDYQKALRAYDMVGREV
jgi:hypothetical protein